MRNRILVVIVSTILIVLLYVLIPSLKNTRNQSRGDVAFQSEKWKKAAKLYERVVSYNPRSSKVLTRLGYCYLKLGKRDRAITIFRQSLRVDSTRFRTYRWLGDAFLQEKAYLNAAQSFRKLIAAYQKHHSLSKADADDYLYALDKLVLCELKLQNDPQALRELHEFTSVLRTKVP
ncbi:MAG: tetratricopeptide repeat protein [Calditrichaeota bacterium]|nr:tetratricopeptide repeat protein [Calditrichota bacterium]